MTEQPTNGERFAALIEPLFTPTITDLAGTEPTDNEGDNE